MYMQSLEIFKQIRYILFLMAFLWNQNVLYKCLNVIFTLEHFITPEHFFQEITLSD